jgi:sarcosine oxidase subunit gamma
VLDVPINRYASSDETLAARLGPDEWLLISPEAAGATMAAALTSQCAGLHHSLVDVSHGYAGFSISGSQATVILNSGCPLDMTVAAFPAGMATRTLLGKAEIVLLRRPGAMLFELQCGRSFAKYVAGFLFEASRELRAARAQRD